MVCERPFCMQVLIYQINTNWTYWEDNLKALAFQTILFIIPFTYTHDIMYYSVLVKSI